MNRLTQFDALKNGEYRDFAKWLPISNTYDIPTDIVIDRQWTLDYLLLYAVCYKNLELIQALLDRGANPNFTLRGSIFQYIIEEDNCSMFELILEHHRGIAIEDRNNRIGAMSVEMMMILKKHRLELFEEKKNGFIIDCLLNKKIQKLKWLLENGGEKRIQPYSAMHFCIIATLFCTDFQWACNEQLQRESAFTIFTMLVEAGLHINSEVDNSESALDYVIGNSSTRLNASGNTYYPIYQRDNRFREQVIDYLIGIGGKLNKERDEDIQRRIDAVRRTKQCMFLLAYDQRHQR